MGWGVNAQAAKEENRLGCLMISWNIQPKWDEEVSDIWWELVELGSMLVSIL